MRVYVRRCNMIDRWNVFLGSQVLDTDTRLEGVGVTYICCFCYVDLL